MIPVASFPDLQYLIASMQIWCQVGWEIPSSVVSHVTSGRKKKDTPKAMPNPVNKPEALGCNVCPSISLSQ